MSRVTLTTDQLVPYIGGQIEIQNEGEEYLYRGEIKSAEITSGNNSSLQIVMAWCAKGEGFPPIPTGWVVEERLDYSLTIDLCSVNNIGPSGDDIGGGDRLAISCPIVGELAVLYPANGSKLDPARVVGLVRSGS